MDSQTPVLVGACAVQQRCEHPDEGVEPVELMIRALEGAAEDAGSRDLLAAPTASRVPHGFWEYSDPARLVAERVGASGARTQLTELGVLQTTLLGRAAADIASGRADRAGGRRRGEARARRAAILGVPERRTVQTGVAPDELLEPHRDILRAGRARARTSMPVSQYAMIENALRAADGRSLEAHRNEIARLWSEMSRVAAGNPDAWTPRRRRRWIDPRRGRGATACSRSRTPSCHNSQWNVDQAAGPDLHLGRARTARGCAREPVDLPARGRRRRTTWCRSSSEPSCTAAPAFAHRGPACGRARVAARSPTLAHLELYSCFPVAVRVQQRELGLPRRSRSR